MNVIAIVASNLSAGTAVAIRVQLAYKDFNGQPLGPFEAQSSPLYVVQASTFSAPNLIAGAAIGLVAILATLVVLLYLGQRKILIDEVFLMTKAGILIRHVSRTPELQTDDDIVASMFVAIQEFVRDSFQREASLDAVTFGRRRAAVVRGELTILAAVASHGDVEYLIPEMLAATRAIEARYWDALVAWDGTRQRLEGLDEALNRLLGGEFRSPWRVQLHDADPRRRGVISAASPEGGTGDRSPPLRRPPTASLVRDALERNEDDPDALFVLAALRVQAGRSDEGLSILDRVLRIDPDYPGAWFFKEKVHRMRGEAEQAESARRRGEALED